MKNNKLMLKIQLTMKDIVFHCQILYFKINIKIYYYYFFQIFFTAYYGNIINLQFTSSCRNN